MAYIQKSTPPPNRILNFSLRNFAGGLNNRSELLEEHQAKDIMNMKFMNDTVMEKRNGIKHYDETILDAPVTFIDEFRPYTDPDVVLRATDAKLYAGTTLIKSVAGRISGANFMGKYFFVDGGFLYVYGKFAQVDASPYVDVIGTPNPAALVLKVITPPAGFTPLPVEHVRGVTVTNYTDGTIYYQPCLNEITDTFKQGNVVPEVPKYLVVRKGRLFLSGSSKDNDNVFITDLNNPYYFPASLPIQLPPNSDRVQDLIVYDNSVVVGRVDDVYAIVGDTNRVGSGFELFTLRKINTHTGFANHSTAVVAHNYLFFLGTDGNAYALSSTRTDEKILSTTIISQTIDLFAEPLSFTQAEINAANGYFFKDEYYLSIKDRVLVYSYRHRAWTVYNHFGAKSFYNLNEVLLWGTSDGRVDCFSEDYFDYGIPYRAFWTSKNLDMGDPVTYKQYRDFFLVAHTFEDFISNIEVSFTVDYGEVRDRFTIANVVSIFGRTRWGDRFINKNITQSLPFTIGRRGRYISFTISNGYDPQGTVATVDLLTNFVGRKYGSLVYVTAESAYYLFDGIRTWTKMESIDINQPARWYQMNGDYEFRGKR